MFFLLHKSQWWRVFGLFSEDFLPLSKDFRRFCKIVPKARRMFPNIFREFPKIPEKMSEDFRRLSKTIEEDLKMFRWYTNYFKYNLRDKLDISEITDVFTCDRRYRIVFMKLICYHSVYHWLLYNNICYLRSRKHVLCFYQVLV